MLSFGWSYPDSKKHYPLIITKYRSKRLERNNDKLDQTFVL